jgi:endo-1,4-beta-mannosidase
LEPFWKLGTSLQALDFVVAEAGKHGVRLLLTLVNNLPEYGGKSRYVQWARDAGDDLDRGNDDHFFTHPKLRDYYEAHVKVTKIPSPLSGLHSYPILGCSQSS